MIAEEFNEDCLELNHVRRSVLQLIAEEASVLHQFVDPTQTVRNCPRYSQSPNEESVVAAYKIRERYWFNQMAVHGGENILVCIVLAM